MSLMSQLETASSPMALVEKLDGTACATAAQTILAELEGLLRANNFPLSDEPLREQTKQYCDLFKKEDWLFGRVGWVWQSFITWMARFHAPTILDTWKPKRYLAQQLAELLDDADESVIPLLVKVRKSLELFLNDLVQGNVEAIVGTRRGQMHPTSRVRPNVDYSPIGVQQHQECRRHDTRITHFNVSPPN
ncbi:hypothetical protein BJ165DRAFT_697006 [Panaeolus papilionaceus]|nr:hypothetical protein BJ165DRAFT_697006 [Panaeolus papilionaceus]